MGSISLQNLSIIAGVQLFRDLSVVIADGDRVGRGALLVHALASGRARDPLAGAVVRCGATIQGCRPLRRHIGASQPGTRQPAVLERGGLVGQNPDGITLWIVELFLGDGRGFHGFPGPGQDEHVTDGAVQVSQPSPGLGLA